MARSTPPTAAEKLRLLADVLLDLADRHEVPSQTMMRAEMLIGEVEQAAEDVRAVVRGRR
jgi:hypothetical protein